MMMRGLNFSTGKNIFGAVKRNIQWVLEVVGVIGTMVFVDVLLFLVSPYVFLLSVVFGLGLILGELDGVDVVAIVLGVFGWHVLVFIWAVKSFVDWLCKNGWRLIFRDIWELFKM